MDKKSLFAGRTGESKSPKSTAKPKKQVDAPPPPPQAAASPTGERKRPVSYGRGGFPKGVAATAQRREVQVKEAEDFRKQANKCLQKTMTRWNPNYFSAAPLFEKAAACYRAAGEDDKATAMFMQAGECQCHDSVMAHASAAKDFREAALITERQERNDEAAALYLRCAEAWVNADEAGRAADYLGRSARLVEPNDEDAAADRYVHASKIMVPPGSDSRTNFVRVVGGCEVLVQAIRFLSSTDRLEECIQVVERYIIILEAEGMEHSLGRMYLTICVLALTLGDYVRADAAFRDVHLQSTSYLHTEECRVEEELLTAVKDSDPDLLRKVQDDRTLRRLETPIVRLAKLLRISGDDEDEDPIPVAATPSGTIGDAQARVGALKEKYGGSPSAAAPARSVALASPNTTPTLSNAPTAAPTPNPKNVVAGKANTKRETGAPSLEGELDDDAAKDSLFGGARKGDPPAKGAVAAAAVVPPEAAAGADRRQEQDLGEASMDLGLGDLEASLAGSGGDDDDLEAAIEAARREAEAIDRCCCR